MSRLCTKTGAVLLLLLQRTIRELQLHGRGWGLGMDLSGDGVPPNIANVLSSAHKL
jgi:hypothetical protein